MKVIIMASQSGTTPMAAENVQNLVLDQPQKEVQQDGKAEVDKPNTTTPLLVKPELIREELVQNAVKFLSHPKVRDSPVIHRRSFLEKKGLTKEEIDEAFKRLPDPPPTAVASNASQYGQVKSPSNNQLQSSTQTLQPSASASTAPTSVVSSLGTLKWSEFHWSRVILAVGLLSISGAGTTLIIKNKIIPRLKSWIRKVVKDGDEELVKRENSRPSLEEEAAAVTKAAIDVAKASQEVLNSKYDDMRKFEEIVGLLNMQLLEMKTLTSAILSLEGDSGRTNFSGRTSVAEGHHLTDSKQLCANRETDYDISAGKSSSPQTQVKSLPVPHPNAYMEDPWKVNHAPSYSNPLHELQRQRERFYSTIPNNGMNYQWNSEEDSASCWQQHNVRIHEPPIRPSWVPPPLPPVSTPQAAEAIQRLKSTVQTETLANNSLITPPDMVSTSEGIPKNGTAGEEGFLGEILGLIQEV